MCSNLPNVPVVQIAPMLGVTDRDFRCFMRGITGKSELWTEMAVENTLLHTNDLNAHLDFDVKEHPIVCQLGGSDPIKVGQAAELVQRWGYDEINLNVGCPSSKVAGKGCFGAALMKTPEIVRDLVYSIKRRCPNMAVSIKTRIGVDDFDSQKYLTDFIQIVSTAGCDRFIMHARKAWLKGLNPSKNRTIPPLQYERVYQLTNQFPELRFSLNGGITGLDNVDDLLYGRWRPKTIEIPRKTRKERRKEELLKLDDKIEDGETTGCDDKQHHNSVTEEDQATARIYDEVYAMMNELEMKTQITGKPILEGVMIGRAALNDPCILASVDSKFYNTNDPITARTRRSIMENYMEHLDRYYPDASSSRSNFQVLKPILGILTGMPGSKRFRNRVDHLIRVESHNACPSELLRISIASVDDEFPGTLDEPTTAKTHQL